MWGETVIGKKKKNIPRRHVHTYVQQGTMRAIFRWFRGYIREQSKHNSVTRSAWSA